MPIRMFLVLVVVLVLVIEKIELVKPGVNRIEDENEDKGDIPARCVSPARHTQLLTTCCQKKPTKGLI
jgi:hypothetical protein